jgi:RND family efflux transporter MFP subunit
MRTNKTIISIVLLTLGLLGCGGAEEHAGEDIGSVSAAVTTVRSREVGVRFLASGTLKGSQTAILMSKAPGFVQEIRFKPGDRVRAGAVLFVLDDRELGAKLRAAQAGLEEARQALTEAESGLRAAEAQAQVVTSTYERFQSLKEKKAVAPQEYDEVEAKYTATVAQRDMAAARLKRVQSSLQRAEAEVEAVKSYTQITAPFSGRVTERRVDIGNLATPGTPLGVIEKAGGLRAEASVPESQVGKIKVGDTAEVWLEGAEMPLEGRVAEVHQGVDVMSRAFQVQVDLSGELPVDMDPRPGSFVRVGLNVGSAQRLLIPRSALVQRGQLEMVYVVDEGKAQTRLVTIGERHGQQIEVLSGLGEGDVVLTEPDESLREGMRVVTQ